MAPRTRSRGSAGPAGVSAAALVAASTPGVPGGAPHLGDMPREIERHEDTKPLEKEAMAMDETGGATQGGGFGPSDTAGRASGDPGPESAGRHRGAGPASGQADGRPGMAEAQAGMRVLVTLGQKALDSARSNTNAAFDHAAALMAARSMADAIELNTAFARRQVESATQQARELTDLIRTAAADSAEPLRSRFDAAFKKQD